MRLVTELMPHNELDGTNLDKIVSLKSHYWKYSKAEHVRWINKNISDLDYHLLLKFNDDELLAYLNIIIVEIAINRLKETFCGIGNVCVNPKHSTKGFGLLIMNNANFFIRDLGKPGVLLCKNKLISFYKKAGWHLYNGKVFLNRNVFTETVFFTETISASVVEIEKNF